ncbi:50S ribosomal protein L19 [Candidatus Falkowbacteria bacterium]|nr:50S ribosomal protein L19 [Candidatus Falkowbacteria bacterium]
MTKEEKSKKSKKTSEEKIDRTFPEVKSGSVVRVHQKIKDVDAKGNEKERIQVFEGLVLARRHGNEVGATITVRKVSGGIGVEKIFPLALPQIEKIEVVKKYKVNRAKIYFTRDYKKKMREVRK